MNVDAVCSGHPAREWDRLALRFLVAATFAITFSIALGQTLLVCTLALTVAHLVSTRRRPVFPIVAWWIAAFVVLAVLTVLFGPFRDAGVHRLRRLIWFMTLPLAATLVRSRADVTALLRALALGCAVLAAEVCCVRPLGVLVRLGREPAATKGFLASYIDRGSMADGQILMLGVLASLCLLLIASPRDRMRAAWRGLLVLESVALAANFKRGSWFCALAFVAAFVALRVNWRLLLPLGAVVAIALALPPVRDRLQTLTREFRMNSGGRATMWFKVAPRLIRNYPSGVGYGSLTNKIMRQYARRVERGRNHLHANVPQVLVETGWAGLILYLGWMGWALYDGGRYVRAARAGDRADATRATAVVLMFGALLANGLVEYNFGDSEVLILYCVLCGMMAVGPACLRREERSAARQEGA